MAIKLRNRRRGSRNKGIIIGHLWTTAHKMFGECRRLFVVFNADPPLSSMFHYEDIRHEVLMSSREKTITHREFLSPQFFLKRIPNYHGGLLTRFTPYHLAKFGLSSVL